MKICMWDIETTDLKALFGRILCCSFQPLNHPTKREVYTFRGDAKPYKAKSLIDDSKLCDAIARELEDYNMIVTWNGKMFDMAFLNARLIKHGLKPVNRPPQFHLDLMYYAGGVSLRIGSRKLDNVQKFLKTGDEKTPIEWETWQLAGTGNKDAMDKVVEHCEADVIVLGEVYEQLLPLVSNVHR